MAHSDSGLKLNVSHTADFAVTGTGLASEWQAIDWQPMQPVKESARRYRTRCKVAWSATGLYFLVDCEDRVLQCTKTEDNDSIFTEDVVEVFLWPEDSQHLYFEYEISPLGVQLPILVPNDQGRFYGWLPWNYSGGRRVRSATSVRGGPKKSLAAIEGWTAEFFIPFALLSGLRNTPPTVGTTWRANIYRIDYDHGSTAHWAWCPDTGSDFHDFRRFGTLTFTA